MADWSQAMPQDLSSYMANIWATRQTETARHHALENYKKDLCLVQDLENKLRISQCWVPGDPEWENAECLVSNQKYQHVVDHLEGLVVAHIFELGKMNRVAQVCKQGKCRHHCLTCLIGYKLWKHIAKVLQVRSAAIQYHRAYWSLGWRCSCVQTKSNRCDMRWPYKVIEAYIIVWSQ